MKHLPNHIRIHSFAFAQTSMCLYADAVAAHGFGAKMIESYFCLRNSIMIELKKHAMNAARDISFSDIERMTGLDIESIVKNKSIKEMLIDPSKTLHVVREDEPFLKYLLKHDQQFICNAIPNITIGYFGLPRCANQEIVTVTMMFSEQIVEGKGTKITYEDVSAYDRIRFLIGAYWMHLDPSLQYIIPLRCFCTDLVQKILPNIPLDTIHELFQTGVYGYDAGKDSFCPHCSGTVIRHIENCLGKTTKHKYCDDFDPDHFDENIEKCSHYALPVELIHDAFMMILFTEENPEEAMERFVRKNVAAIRVMESFSKIYIGYLPEKIYDIYERVVLNDG